MICLCKFEGVDCQYIYYNSMELIFLTSHRAIEPSCMICKRKIRECGKTKAENYRYNIIFHADFLYCCCGSLCHSLHETGFGCTNIKSMTLKRRNNL